MGRYRKMKKTDVTKPRPQGAKTNAANKKMASKYSGVHECKKDYLSNKEMSEAIEATLYSTLGDGEKLIFVIVSDLDNAGKYGESALAFTDKRVINADAERAESYEYSEIGSAKAKRMYGNAAIYIEGDSLKRTRVFRYTYSIVALCDMAAQFLNDLAGGTSFDSALEIVQATYDKLNLVCPKCGRTLLRAGAQCIQCQSKTKVVAKLVKYVKPEFKSLMLCVLISCVTTFLALVPPYMTRTIVDEVLPMSVAGEIAKGMAMLTGVVILLLGTHFLSHALGALRGYLTRRSGDRIVLNLRNDVYKKAQHLPMKFYDKTSTGSVINRISGDTATIQAFVLKITQECIVQFILMIGIILIMLIMNPKLTLLSLIPVPLVVIGSRIFSKKIAPFYHKIWRRWAKVTSVMTDTVPCIRVVKAFAGEDRAVDRFEKQNAEWYKVDMAAKITMVFPHIISFAVTCGSLLIWAVGGRWALLGDVSAGLLVSFISYASMFYGPVNFFAALSDSYQSALASTERILDILDAETEQNRDDAIKVDRLDGKIEFKNVNFSFDKTKKTLSNVSLTIEAGDIVGIVGTTGSGKSTLINLLLRFYDNYEGEILVDGHNIKDLDINSYRSCIGYVQQEPMMFSDTIFNNIAYGIPNASVEQVIHAAEVANAHEFITKQPDCYDSMLGERGVGLSGGEKQRLSIARAVLKNPSILVFDEATAAVDSETENQIQEAIERLISGRTTLMIAHRLSTLRKANKIVVVDEGKIIEFGSHDELMALKGKYYRLIEIQSMSNKDTISIK